MQPEPSSVPSPETQDTEKQPWTPPEIKKMDIEETAIGIGGAPDADGLS